MPRKISINNNVEAIDLFCGIGGLTYGLNKAGIKVIAGLDFDNSCEYAYEKNNNAPFISADISDYSSEKLINKYSDGAIKVLVGCAPCQTFSKHTQKNPNRISDKKWTLLNSFSEKVESISPDIISMENVPGLVKYEIFKNFLNILQCLGYHVNYEIVKCEEYGIPQFRRRLVLLASKFGEISLIRATHKASSEYRTVKDVIGAMPKIIAGATHPKDKLHKSSELTKINLERIKQSKPGGTWRDWDPSLLPECYKRSSGQSYSSVYGRLSWNKPSATITTQFNSFGTGRFGHPVQDRALSLREGAMLQTFPKNYKFVKAWEEVPIKHAGRHIGNAVPVRLGEVIGKSILLHIKGAFSEGRQVGY